MAYDSSYRRRDSDSTDTFGAIGRGDSNDLAATDPGWRTGASPATFDDVFDDPAHGEPGRDQLGVHIAWEVLLLVGVVAAALLLYGVDHGATRGTALRSLLVSGAALGLLALGAGLALRAGAPNLALGPAAVAAALHFAENSDRGAVDAVLPAVAAAAGLGLVLALVVVGLHVPGWAASLGAGLAVMVFIEQRSAPVDMQGGYDPKRSAFYLFGGFAALALLGGLFGTIKAVRRSLGRFRPVSDPARRRGGFAAALTAGSIALSGVFAVLAGVLLAGNGPGPVRPTSGIEWTGLALGAALLGGTSAFGRRGGIFGTLFAVTLLTLAIAYVDERNWDLPLVAIAAAAIAVGLVVTRLVETYGRPRPTSDGGGRTPEAATTSTWSGGRTDSWSSALPAQPTDSRPDAWGSDRWSVTDR